MLMIKRFVFIMLSAMIVLTACSKDNKTQKKAKPSASKVVDLGENEDAAAPEEGDDKAAKKKPPSNRQAQANRDSKKRPPRPSVKNEDKPAEDESAAVAKDAAPSKDVAKQESAKKPEENKADVAPADDSQKAFDFSDDTAPSEPTPRILKKREGLDIENLITIRELREQTGYVGALTQTDLVGQASDPKYNVIRVSTDKSSELGFAVQVWKPGNESAASKRFEEIYKQSFGGVKQKEIASDAFLASHHSITELGFYDKAKRAVVLISCSDSVCKADQLKNIATTIQRRL